MKFCANTKIDKLMNISWQLGTETPFSMSVCLNFTQAALYMTLLPKFINELKCLYNCMTALKRRHQYLS